MAPLNSLLTLLLIPSLALSSILPIPSPSHYKPRTTSDDDDDTPLPLVIWHGLGDNYAAEGLTSIAALAEEIHPGTLTYIIRLDEDPSADRSATFFGNLTLQLDKVCADLAAHPILSTAPAIDALGFSQGGQFLRGYIERCNFPPVRSLVTFGSQHNGISEFQACGPTDWLCKGARGLLRSNTWSDFVQSRLVPAQYFRDPEQLDSYLESSNFLADINNERELKNQTYKENLGTLERFVMYLFEEDETVVPRETGWFAEVNGTEVTLLRDRDIYKEDWIGLKVLDERGVLKF
ncbi:Palmitoyl-protein thioesterase, partial [Lachnellula suecica]